ncbi:hypothetical protein CB1_001678001 [Camelus ferus]|nr:hypothetical protein CB1_001678001 [Camelus ferus]
MFRRNSRRLRLGGPQNNWYPPSTSHGGGLTLRGGLAGDGVITHTHMKEHFAQHRQHSAISHLITERLQAPGIAANNAKGCVILWEQLLFLCSGWSLILQPLVVGQDLAPSVSHSTDHVELSIVKTLLEA